MNKVLLLSAALIMGGAASAQQTARGILKDYADSSSVPQMLIRNTNLKTNVQADASGRFSIKAHLFDTLIFSGAGYLPDTLLVDEDFFRKEIEVFVRRNAAVLKEVVVQADRYRQDSLESRERYNQIYADRERVFMRNHGNGFGVTLSPLTYFSKKEKDRRALLKREKREEEAAYVNYRFSRSKVIQLTGLRGDSLQTFLIRYRPTYEFCTKASETDITLYINQSLKEFLKKED